MIPVNGAPLISHIADNYGDAAMSVAVHESGQEVLDYCTKNMTSHNILVFDVGPTESLGETILALLKLHLQTRRSIVINFADTLVHNVETSCDSIYCAELEDLYRWTTFQISAQGEILDIEEKGTNKQNSNALVFIGVFVISNANAFAKMLDKAKRGKPSVDPFYAALADYSREFHFTCRRITDWFDFGHLDTYYESHKRLASRCREFNSVQVDTNKGSIVKSSRNAEKFIGEIEWYLKLPAKLQYIAPRIFSYSTDYQNPFVEMEFYGYPVLSDLFLYGQLDIGAWTRIFQALDFVIDDMSTFKAGASPAVLRKSLKNMYVDKTLQRIAQYSQLPGFNWAKSPELHVNGIHCIDLASIAAELEATLDSAGIFCVDSFSVIHGDLCFSNILYDSRNGIIRLVDPRGKFGEFDIYGDPRYDFCKISHSINGDYDFLLNGRFDFLRDGSQITLHPHVTEAHMAIKDLFLKKFVKRYGSRELMRTRLLESLLFLSMVPLHADRPASQQAFLATGMLLFTEMSRKAKGELS